MRLPIARGARVSRSLGRRLALPVAFAAAAVLGVWLLGVAPVEAANAPAVSAVSPSQGPFGGGTAVTITGSDFVTGATVTFNGVAATGVTFVSSTSITATTPAGTQGAAVIEVTNPDTQSGTLSGAFTYLAAPPAITLVNPNTGSSLGGTAVTITGTGFVAGATVTFGGTAATAVTFDSATQLTVTTPAHTAGAVDVVVTNPDAQSVTSTGGYTYTAAAAPTVTSLSPSSGTTGGGTVVTITGTGFATGATVAFDGLAATAVSVAGATSMTAATPAHAAGAVAVVVTNPDSQTGTLGAGFTYAASAAPTVTAVSPASGSKGGGTAVTITGTGFLAGATVDFGGSAGTNVTVAGATSITATTPAHAKGKVIVKVTNTDAQSGSLANGFEFLDAPTLTAVDPALGATTGGTALKLTGTNFLAGAKVTVGGTAATNVVIVTATEITATAPAHAAGAVDIVVTNTDLQAATLTAKFTYAVAPTLTAVVANTGSTEGGTLVTLAGAGFEAGATVQFGEVAATEVTLTSGEVITAKTPAQAAGSVGVTVTNPNGLSATLASGFSYEAPDTTPTITGGAVPSEGLAFIVFSGGTSSQLVDAVEAAGCVQAKLRLYATDNGVFVPYIPASKVALVNAPWNTLFASGIPSTWPFVVVCG
jgi:hypothetical protein